MRYIFIIAGILLLSVPYSFVRAQEKEAVVTIQMSNASVREVLTEIEQQAGIRFTYESTLLDNLPKVSFTVRSEPLDNCLRKLFLSLPVIYQASGKYIILKKKPRKVTVSGFIRDNASSESLAGASFYELRTRQGTVSNNDGFFSIQLDPGDISLQASYIGYKSESFRFPHLEQDTTLMIGLKENTTLQEVVVTASNNEQEPVLTTHLGRMEVTQKEIQSTPTLFGEADIIKTLQLTPGVSSGAEGFTGMYVRGGEGDDNLFMVDGNPVYQISHVGGIFSAFNAEAVRNMDFYKGSFPARFGGRLSSVVDVHIGEGNMKEYHGSASLGLTSGGLRFEGPIIKDKTSFLAALRHTWLDALTIPALAIVNSVQRGNTKGRYAFYDLNLKLNHKFNEHSRIFLSVYNGHDLLRGGYKDTNDTPETDENSASLDWGNLLVTGGWTYMFSNRLFGKVAGVFTRYGSEIKQSNEHEYGHSGTEEYEKTSNENASSTGIVSFGFRTSFDYYPVPQHHARFGMDAMTHRFRPEYSRSMSSANTSSDSQQFEQTFAADKLQGSELSAYVEDDWDIARNLSLNGGLRFTLFNIDNKAYSSVEPRLSLRWLLRDNLSLKASYARMNQYVHLVSESYINLPTDSWMPVTANLKPMVSDQVSLGAYYNLKGNYDFSVEGYYKKMDHLLEYRDGYSFLPTFSSWEEKLTAGEGRAYGIEFMARKQTGNTTGWIGYTLSWADRKFDEINGGERFPSKYDNRHKINIVVMHKISPKVELSAGWTYSSGNRTTLPLENYEGILPNSTYDYDYVQERNNYQFVPYHRLDLGVNIYRPKKSGNMGIWNISIYNAYNRMNPFMILKGSKEIKNIGNGYSVPVFRTIGILPVIPSITYTYKF